MVILSFLNPPHYMSCRLAYLRNLFAEQNTRFFSLLKQKYQVIYFMTITILHTISPMAVSFVFFNIEVICIGLAQLPPVFSSQKIRSVKSIQKKQAENVSSTCFIYAELLSIAFIVQKRFYHLVL